jgi:hypothetical protein
LEQSGDRLVVGFLSQIFIRMRTVARPSREDFRRCMPQNAPQTGTRQWTCAHIESAPASAEFIIPGSLQ